eukprot:SAG11_NODE_23542_length_386_cov_10.013937_1_plen_31_part_01
MVKCYWVPFTIGFSGIGHLAQLSDLFSKIEG